MRLEKGYLIESANSKDSDQTAHQRSLIGVLAIRHEEFQDLKQCSPIRVQGCARLPVSLLRVRVIKRLFSRMT